MTVYELIQELTSYDADAKVTFQVGKMTTDSVMMTLHEYTTGDELVIELD